MYEKTEIGHENEYDFQNCQSNSWEFTDFETARKAMRNRIVEYAAGKSALFDEPGEMSDIKEYVKMMIDSVLAEEGDEEQADALREFSKTLRSFLTDPGFPKAKEELNTCLELFSQDGWSICFDITNEDQPELICMYLSEEVRMSGITPYIYTNCFIMNDPDRKYSFHIENGFVEQDYTSCVLDYTSFVFLGLEKVG